MSPKWSLIAVPLSLLVFFVLGACSPRAVPSPLCINGTYVMRGEAVMRGEDVLKLVISGSRYTLNYGGEQLSGKVEFRLGLDGGDDRILAFYPEAGRFSNSSKIRIEQQMTRIGADPFFLSDFENLQTPFNYEVVQQWNDVYIFMDYDGTHFRKPC